MSGSRKNSKILMGSFLQTIADRDRALLETLKVQKFRRDSSIPTIKRKSSDVQTKEIIEVHKEKNLRNETPLLRAPVASIHFKDTPEVMEFPNPRFNVPDPSISTSTVSELSMINSISSMRAPVKLQDDPLINQNLVIPFSGFTKADVDEIKGDVEPITSFSSKTPYWQPTKETDVPSVLQKRQSEIRKTSLSTNVKDNSDNFLQPYDNTEESSYSTVLEVKIMVESSKELDEKVAGEEMTDSQKSNGFPSTSKNPTILNKLQEELNEVTTELQKLQLKYEDAEKAYFTAKLNMHRMKLKHEKLVTQLKTLENEMSRI